MVARRGYLTHHRCPRCRFGDQRFGLLVILSGAARGAWPSCHPERRAQSARSRRISRVAGAFSKGGAPRLGCVRPNRAAPHRCEPLRPGRSFDSGGFAASAQDDKTSSCHPERRARSARSRRTSLVAGACGKGGVPWLGCSRSNRETPPSPQAFPSREILRLRSPYGLAPLRMTKDAHPLPCHPERSPRRGRSRRIPPVAGAFNEGGVPRSGCSRPKQKTPSCAAEASPPVRSFDSGGFAASAQDDKTRTPFPCHPERSPRRGRSRRIPLVAGAFSKGGVSWLGCSRPNRAAPS